MSYSIPNLPATYYTTLQDGRYVVFLNERSLMSFTSKADAQAYAVTHNRLHNTVGE